MFELNLILLRFEERDKILLFYNFAVFSLEA